MTGVSERRSLFSRDRHTDRQTDRPNYCNPRSRMRRGLMKAIALNQVAVAELKITLTTRTAMAGLERLQRFGGDKRLVHEARFHPMNP